MSLHKLTAGDGYSYLTRQVAAADATERGVDSLADYYSSKGESPGTWMGSGLAQLDGVEAGSEVSEAQMKALFGEGRHPNADEIEAAAIAEGVANGLPSKWVVKKALAKSQLGNPYRVYNGVSQFRTEVADAFVAHNTALGVAPNAEISVEIRGRIRTEIAHRLYAAEHGRPAENEREISGFIAKNSHPETTAVAGYDLTFSPVKSVSTLWAVAPMDIAEKIAQAHSDAVSDALRYLEENAIYTRLGRNGVQQVDVEGIVAAAFTHRDSRAGDPDLHTHVAVSNKVKVAGTEQWRALDGQPLYKANVAASELYNSRLEAHLRKSLGVSFAEREGADPTKRAIREIVGIDTELMGLWSSRRAAIDVRRRQLAAQFQTDHGREPTPVEALSLAQQATLETRAAKHEPRAYADQRAAWQAEAVQVLGDLEAVKGMVRGALSPEISVELLEITDEWITASAESALEIVSSSRARWQVGHVRAEAERIVRAKNVSLALMDSAVESIVSRALSPTHSINLSVEDEMNEPAVLRRKDGRSVYSRAGTAMYSSEKIMAAEQRMVDAAARTDGRAVDTSTVDMALLEQAANDFALNNGQAQLVRDLATSGARVQLALAPAGTGKTTAMAVLARAWEGEGGTVLGLAPTAAAAAALRKDLDATTETLSKLTHVLGQITAAETDPSAHVVVPEWMDAIDEKTLVVVDEAGMAGTPDLDAMVAFVLERGGSVRLVGDDQQLASVSCGGVLRDIAKTAGAVTLTDVMRFTDPAEGAATLALRDGDPAAIGFYLDHGRLHVGDLEVAENKAFTAWSTDRKTGLDSVMLAPTREMVRGLNERARAERLATESAPAGAEVLLADGLLASVGDVITTRKNNRQLAISATDFVRNGDRWTITEIREDGGIRAQHLGSQKHVVIPAEYVKKSVQLGYARTIHGAQGITADTCHTIATGGEARQLAYVALSRGKFANHLYMASASTGDEHSVMTPDGLAPPSAVDLFTRILANDGAQESALSTQRRLADPHTRLALASDAYADALSVAAMDLLGEEAMQQIDAAAESAVPGLTDEDAYSVLRGHVALLMLGGQDPARVFENAVGNRELDSALDKAAVLDWRIDPTGQHSAGTGPLPWLPAVPDVLAENEQWGEYLTARAQMVTDLAADVRAVPVETNTPAGPMWARGRGDADHDLLQDVAVWRAAMGVDPTELALTGRPRYARAEQRHQEALERRASAATAKASAQTARWTRLANKIDARITADPYWPAMMQNFDAAAEAGADIAALAREVTADSPLPDELPASALWWRISRRLSVREEPAKVAAQKPQKLGHRDLYRQARRDYAKGTHELYSALTASLIDAMGADTTAFQRAPEWRQIVQTVAQSETFGWDTDSLLRSAVTDLPDGANPAAAAAERISVAARDRRLPRVRTDELATQRLPGLTRRAGEHDLELAQRSLAHARAMLDALDGYITDSREAGEPWTQVLTPHDAEGMRQVLREVGAARITADAAATDTDPYAHLTEARARVLAARVGKIVAKDERIEAKVSAARTASRRRIGEIRRLLAMEKNGGFAARITDPAEARIQRVADADRAITAAKNARNTLAAVRANPHASAADLAAAESVLAAAMSAAPPEDMWEVTETAAAQNRISGAWSGTTGSAGTATPDAATTERITGLEAALADEERRYRGINRATVDSDAADKESAPSGVENMAVHDLMAEESRRSGPEL